MDSPRKTPPELAAIILAAGLSRRMGAFKPLLPFGGATVIQHTIDYFHATGVQTIVVVIGHEGEKIRTSLAQEQITFAENPNPEGPMLDSVKLGLENLPPQVQAFFITPSDYPALSSDVLRSMIVRWQRGTRVVIPTWEGRGGHPVLIDASLRDELRHFQAERGLRAFFTAHEAEVERLPVDSSYVVRDMDTWDDYVRLHIDFFGVPPDVAGTEP